jgi:hypothetical protein
LHYSIGHKAWENMYLVSPRNEGHKKAFSTVYSKSLINQFHRSGNDTIAGIFSSASKEGVVYAKPDSWGTDEVINGTLYLRDLKNRQDKKVLDSIDPYNPLSAKLGDKSFIVCSNKQVYNYNSQTSTKESLFTTSNHEFISGIAFNEIYNAISFITFKIDEKIAIFYLYDIAKSKVVYKKNLPPSYTDDDNGLASALKSVNKKVIFNTNGNLYIFDLESQKLVKVTNQLAFNTKYQFSVSTNKIIYLKIYWQCWEFYNKIIRYKAKHN